MATNAWVDWSKLPNDIGRKIFDTATDPGTRLGRESYHYQISEIEDAKSHITFADRFLRQDAHDYFSELREARTNINHYSRRARDVYASTQVQTGESFHPNADHESFHPNADRTTPMERAKYAAMTALAVGSVGLGLAKWQTTPKDERSKANVLASPEPTAKAERVKSEL